MSRKHMYRSGGGNRLEPKIDPMPPRHLRGFMFARDNAIADGFEPRTEQHMLLMGERVRDVERACAIFRASGGIFMQRVKSGVPQRRITYLNEEWLRLAFPTNMKKHDYMVVVGLTPKALGEPQ